MGLRTVFCSLGGHDPIRVVKPQFWGRGSLQEWKGLKTPGLEPHQAKGEAPVGDSVLPRSPTRITGACEQRCQGGRGQAGSG